MGKLIYNIENIISFIPMQEATKFPLDISFIAREDELKYHLFSLSP
jgi:hypothetical protein